MKSLTDEIQDYIVHIPKKKKHKEKDTLEFKTLKAVYTLLKPTMKYFNIGATATTDKTTFKKTYVVIDEVPEDELKSYFTDCLVKYFEETMHAEALYTPWASFKNMIIRNANSTTREPMFWVLVGCPGIGKSSLIRYFIDNIHELKSKVTPQISISSSDFNTGEFDTTDVQDGILSSISSELSINAFCSSNDRIKSIVRESKEKIIIHIVDNVDRQGKMAVELKILEAVIQVQSELRACRAKTEGVFNGFTAIIISVRRSTFLQTYGLRLFSLESVSIGILPPPPLIRTFKKRLILIKEEINQDNIDESIKIDGIISGTDYNASLTINIDRSVEILEKIFINMDEGARRYLNIITLGNVRAQLRIMIEFLRTNVLTKTPLMQWVLEALTKTKPFSSDSSNLQSKPIKRHHIIQALDEFQPLNIAKQDFIADENLLACFPDNKAIDYAAWSCYLVKIRILQYLLLNGDNDIGNGGYLKNLYNSFNMIGYPYHILSAALEDLSESRLIMIRGQDSHWIHPESPAMLVITSVGEYYYKELLLELTYVSVKFGDCLLPKNFYKDNPSNIFLQTVAYLGILKKMEAAEAAVSKILGESSEKFLNKLQGDTPISEMMSISFMRSFEAI
ncbi:MAG: hypothetical protein H7839_17410, partial [Magnetococcus sp. YQC-5]